MKTKLQLLIFLAVLYISCPVKAQQPDSSRIHFNFLLNLVGTILNYGNDNASVKDYKRSVLGGQIGIAFEGTIAPNISIVSELYFSVKGGKLKDGNPLFLTESILRQYGFELPILARIHFSGFHINAGPSVAYNFKTTHSLADQPSGLDYKNFEAGLQAGGGYSFNTQKKRLTLDLRYNYGLTNISKTNEMYNRSFIVSLKVAKGWKSNSSSK